MYTTQNGEKIFLGASIAKGGEGEVFNIKGDESFCVKLYHDSKKHADKENKIKYMSLNPPETIEGSNYKICWPKEVLYKDGKFAGYIMSKAFENSYLPYHLCQPTIPSNLSNEWHLTYKRETTKGVVSRLKLCTNIISAVNRVHSSNKYVIVDFKPQNILVTISGKVSLLDLDSIQITKNNEILFKAPVTTPEYAPPEASDVIKSNKPILTDWDTFSVAVVVYEILCGIHPYVGTAKPPFDGLNTIQEKIKNNLTFISKGKESFSVLPDPHKTFDSFSAQLKSIYKKIFKPYKIGISSRPKLEEFGKALYTEAIEYGKRNQIEAHPKKTKTIKKEPSQANHTKEVDKLKKQIKNLHEKTQELKEGNDNKLAAIIILLVMLILTIGIGYNFISKYKNLYITYHERYNKSVGEVSILTNKKNKLKNDYQDLMFKYNESNDKISDLKENLTNLTNISPPIIIQNIKFGSVKNSELNSDYGNLLNKSKLFYLVPKITYYGIKEGHYDIKVKIFNPDGYLKKGESSPKGYVFIEKSKHILTGNHTLYLKGWGNNYASSYKPGTYRYEVWINNGNTEFGASKTFMVYDW